MYFSILNSIQKFALREFAEGSRIMLTESSQNRLKDVVVVLWYLHDEECLATN